MRSIENRPLKSRPGLLGALRQRLAPLVIAATLLTNTAAEARTDVCYTGGINLSNFKLNGTATLNGIDLLVTPDAGTQLGSAMFIPQFAPTSDIHVQMKLKITTTIQPGADGMAFIMHRAPAGISALGLSGGGIGYGGLAPSIAIEMDTFTNAGDPNDNHIGITQNGITATHLATYTPPFTMRTVGTPFTVWIDYTASATRFDVFISQSDTKPATPQLTQVLNVAAFFGNMPFYMGFTGSTGGAQSQHEILSLIASDGSTNACCATNADCAGNPQGALCDPEKHVCGQCLPTNVTACPVGSPRCDTGTANNTCAPPCMSNFNSGMSGACTSAATPFCVTAGANAGTCVTCNGNYNSGAMFACPQGAPTCTSDGQCIIPCVRDNGATGTGGVACPTAAKPYCSAQGTCTTCTKDGDCTTGTHAGPFCDTATGACTPKCSRDAQCSTDEPVCNSEGTCIACTTDNDCTTGTHAGPSCNTSTGACGGCTTDAQCATGQYCDHPADAAGTCAPKVANDQPLPQSTPCTTANAARICQSGICSPSGSCVECVTYDQCASGLACGSDNHCINGALSGGGFSCATAPGATESRSPVLALAALALSLALSVSLRRRRATN